MLKAIAVVEFGSAVLAVGALAIAQEPIVRKPLQKQDYPGDAHASHIMHITVAPGALVARHTHPGIEMGYLTEGELSLTIEGKPELISKAGDSYAVPPGAIHSAKNTGSAPAKIVGTFVVEKAKPLASPAP